MRKNIFTEKIILWYQENKRLLPWRETKNPYKIWLSEIILQQTRVVQGIPYYLKFEERFPTVEKLAAASEQEVLRLWQGLGYYTRARNLHRCAKIITSNYNEHFPMDFAELQKLPGIGQYTAAAIASIAFKIPVAVVDGNVYRVLARYFAIDKDISRPETKKYFFSLANELISAEHPDEYNQAVMEFGALHCTPQLPGCDECVLQKTCRANATNQQKLFPVKSKKAKTRNRYLYYLVIQQNEKLVLRKRTGKDIWQGLYDFYSIETKRPRVIAKIIEGNRWLEENSANLEIGEPSGAYKHVLSHQTLAARFIPVRFKSGRTFIPPFEGEKMKSYSPSEVHDLPKPVLVSKHLSDIGFL